VCGRIGSSDACVTVCADGASSYRTHNRSHFRQDIRHDSYSHTYIACCRIAECSVRTRTCGAAWVAAHPTNKSNARTAMSFAAVAIAEAQDHNRSRLFSILCNSQGIRLKGAAICLLSTPTVSEPATKEMHPAISANDISNSELGKAVQLKSRKIAA
jgi:hypothetical protein